MCGTPISVDSRCFRVLPQTPLGGSDKIFLSDSSTSPNRAMNMPTVEVVVSQALNQSDACRQPGRWIGVVCAVEREGNLDVKLCCDYFDHPIEDMLDGVDVPVESPACQMSLSGQLAHGHLRIARFANRRMAAALILCSGVCICVSSTRARELREASDR